MSTLAGSLYIEMSANLARLAKDMADAKASVSGAMGSIEKSVGQAKAALGALGLGLSVGAFVSFVKGAIDSADHLNKLAQRTGIATESLSQLMYAAKLADVSNESLTNGLKKLNVSIAAGLAGDKEKLALFKQLGITTADLGKGTESVMLKMADAYAHAKDGAGKTAVSIGLIGKAGDEMIPLLNGGAQALRDLMKEADRLGLTIGPEFAEKAEEFNDNLTRIQMSSQKLAIILGTDVVEGTGKAMKAFADATIQGNKLAGIVAFVQTLFTGDDQHKANVQLVEDTDKLLRAENALLAARATGMNPAGIAAREKLVADLKEQIKTTQIYRGALIQEEDAAKAAAKAIKDARENGKTLGVPNKESMAEYDALIKRIQERIDLNQAEIKAGRELSDIEKFESKILTDLKAAKVALNAAQIAAVTSKLEEAKAGALVIQQRKQELDFAKQIAQQVFSDDAEMAAHLKAQADERDKVNKTIADQAQALTDSNAQLRLEATLIGATDAERAIALGNLQVEQKLQHDLDEVNRNLLMTEEARVAARAALYANADVARAQVAERAALEEQVSLINSLDTTAHSVWTNIFEGGSSAFKKLGQVLKASLLDLLYQMTIKKWIISIGASLTGGIASAAGGSVLSGGLGSLFGSATMGSLSSGGGIIGSISNALGLGSATGASFASSVGGGLATDAMGATVIEAAASTGASSGIAAGLAAVPGWGWAAAGVLALASIFGKSGGGPKTEGGYAPNGMNIAGIDIGGNLQGSQRGDVSSAMQISQAISQSYSALATQLGLLNHQLDVGVFFAKDPEGNSLTQLQIATNSYNRSDRLGGIENVGRTDDDLKAAIAEETTRVIFNALKSSDLPELYKSWLNSIAADASTSEMMPAIDHVSKAMTERQQLESKLFDLTATDLEKLNKTRDAERAAVDDSNRALLEQIYAEEDLRSATSATNAALQRSAAITAATNAQIMTDLQNASQDLATAQSAAQQQVIAGRNEEISRMREMANTAASSASRLRSAADAMRSLRDSLMLGDLSPLTPGEKYAEARRQFDAAVSSGDYDKISSAATEFLKASQVYNASGGAFSEDFARVQAVLTTMSAKASSAATIADHQSALLETQIQQLENLNKLDTVNSSVLSVEQAVINLGVAVAAALGAGLNPGAGNLTALTGGVTGQYVNTSVGQVYASTGGAAVTGGTLYTMDGKSYTLYEAQTYINSLLEAGRQVDAYYAFKTAGISLADADKLMGWPTMTAEDWATANGYPVFHNGIDFVPETGFALLERGERVTSANRNAGGDDVVSELRELGEKIIGATRAQIQANFAANDQAAEKVVDGTTKATTRAAWTNANANEARSFA